MFKKIRTKIMVVVGIIILLLIIGSSWFSYNQGRNILQQTLLDAAETSAQQNAELLDEFLSGSISNIRNLNISWFNDRSTSDSDMVVDMYWYNHQDNLNRIVKEQDHLETLFVADAAGNYQITSGEKGNISEREYFQRARKTGELVISNPITSQATGEDVIVIAQPVMNDDGLLAVVGGTIKLSHFRKYINEMKIGGTGTGWIVNSDQITIAHPEDKFLANKQIFEESGQKLKDITSRMAAGKTGTAEYQLDDTTQLIAFAPLETTDWSVAIYAAENQVLSPVNTIRQGNLVIGLIAILIGLAASYFLARNISSPIQNLTRVVKKVAEGNLSLDLQEFNTNNQDEIGDLTNYIQEMVINLRSMIKQISNLAEETMDYSRELSSTGEQVGTSAEQVGTSIENVASGAEEQSAQIEETSATVAGLVDKIERVNSTSKNLQEDSRRVRKQIKEGNKTVNNSVEKINKMEENTKQVAERINQLGQSSQEIGKIVEIISNISKQTNLLALNAAIEAARAGKAGQGFSVVADEIRELAEESSESTDRIAELIKNIQNGIEKAVADMDQGVKIVNNSVEAIEKSGNIFARIDQIAEKFQERATEMADKCEDMSLSSEKVKEAINDIAAVSEEAASNSQQVAAASEEQIAATEEIVSSAKELADLADNLMEAVNEFKV